jgi:TonB family protein
MAVGLLACASFSILAPSALGQEDGGRKVRTKVNPVYPELARKMNVAGTVKVEITIGSNGIVKNTKVVGGHPLLVNAALDAVKRWKFEPGDESSQIIAFNFTPNQ